MMTSGRKRLLLVACERGGFRYTCAFACRPDDGRWLLDQIQRGRRDRDEPPLPRLEDLTTHAQETVDTEQTGVLTEIRDLMRRQLALLERIAERLER